jgi:hypothetical protein
MTDADRCRLLHGPYRPPRLRKGGRAFCLYRDVDVVVTGWTDARFPGRVCGRRVGGLGRRPVLDHAGELLVGEDGVDRHGLGLGDLLAEVAEPREDGELLRRRTSL